MQMKDCPTCWQGIVSAQHDETGHEMLCRFSQKQMWHYAADEGYHIRSKAGAGMCFHCITDSELLELVCDVFPASSLDFWGFDLLMNHRLYTHIEGSISQSPHVHWQIHLPAGEKEIRLCFPCLAGVSLHRLDLIGGHTCHPIPQQKRLLCMGDSITQGYTVHFPSLSYTSALAEALDMELLNQAIAGETFCPDMLDDALPFTPDLIMVAYGTNDWSCKTEQSFAIDANAFIGTLRAQYSRTDIAILSPLWRSDLSAHPEHFAFEKTQTILSNIAGRHNAVLLPSTSLLPAITELLVDHVHPNDLGHAMLAHQIALQLRRHMKV